MKSIEFFNVESEVWYKGEDGKTGQLSESNREIVVDMYEAIKELYPDAYLRLSKMFGKLSFSARLYQFRVVKRFCKCNFGEVYQSKADIDGNGRFHFEKVQCPLRGECEHEGIVCMPKFNSKISDAEMRVLELVFKGLDYESIAGRLFLSEHTVRNHVRNAYTRIGLHEKAEFIDYAHRNNLFKED